LLNELPHLKRLIVFFIKYIRLINKKDKQRGECLFNFDYEKIYFHVVGGKNDDKVSKVMTCSLSLGPFVLAHPGRG